LRIHFNTRAPLGTTHPEFAATVERVAEVLRRLGHTVVEAPLPDGSFDEVLPLWQMLVAKMPVLPWRWSRVQPVTRWLADAGKRLRAADVHALQKTLETRLRSALDVADLWLTPTTPNPAPPIGYYDALEPHEAFKTAAQMGSFTAAFNITGHPAASLPMGLTADGLPIGVQLGGRLFGDADVLAVSRELEEALPWKERLSPLMGGTASAPEPGTGTRAGAALSMQA
jgi:amidase